MKKKYFILLFLSVSCSIFSQVIDYNIKSQNFKTPLTAVNVSPNGAWLLVGSEDGMLSILDSNSFETIRSIENAGTSAIFDIEMSPLMDVIFIASGNKILLYDTLGTYINSWGHHKNTIWSMDINKKGDLILSAEVNKTFQLINVYEGIVEKSMRGHEDITLAVAFSPDGKKIASGSNDKNVFIWDLKTKEKIAEFQGLSDNIYDVAFSPDGKLIAACSKDQSVRIWNIEEKKLVQLIKGHQGMVLEIEFSPNGKYLLSASSDQAIKLWDITSGELLYAYLENESSITDIEFLHDGKTFVSTCMDGYLRQWEINPEIFVLKYFQNEFESELKENPLFLPREKGEKKVDYEIRREKAEAEKAVVIDRYYQKYLDL